MQHGIDDDDGVSSKQRPAIDLLVQSSSPTLPAKNAEIDRKPLGVLSFSLLCSPSKRMSE